MLLGCLAPDRGGRSARVRHDRGADDPERMVPWLAMPGVEFEVLEPPEVVAAVRTVAERLLRAAPLTALSPRPCDAAAAAEDAHLAAGGEP